LVLFQYVLAAAAADEEEPPLPYEESPPEDGDTDEPDWGSHHDDTNADPDYEPFDGGYSCCMLLVLAMVECALVVCIVNGQQPHYIGVTTRGWRHGRA
jgi:hypothetical protein